jgi:hypothetical protein
VKSAPGPVPVPIIPKKPTSGAAQVAAAPALRALGVLFEPGDVIEIRALDVGRTEERAGVTYSGYFNFENERAIRDALRSLHGRAEGVYVILNRLNPELLARANNRLQARPKHTTSDPDIIERRWLYIDADAVRPAGISASDVEHDAALARTLCIREFLAGRRFPEPIHCDSGNGGHLLYLLPLLDLERAGQLVKMCLKALAARFSDSVVKVDESTGNAARLCKLYGTEARKGDATPDRPHRQSMILDEPERVQPVPIESLEALALEVPGGGQPPKKEGTPLASKAGFDIDQWLERSGLEIVSGPDSYHGGRRWTLSVCPFNAQHQKPVVIELVSGALVYKCLHQSCTDRGWQALRDMVEPDRQSALKSGIKGRAPSTLWEPPIPFHQFKLPPFPAETLPGWLRAFVEAEATATQTPMDLAGMLVLSVIAAICAKKVVVQVKAGYSEPVNIFTVTALPPGNRKTAVFAAVTKPLEEFEYSEAKRTAGEIAQANTAHKIKEAALKRLQEQAATATGKKREEFTREAGAVAAELAEMVVAVPTRCIVDDCTSEKLASILRDHGGRIALMSAEGDVFDVMAGRYSSNSTSNFGVYLKGHAGDTLRVDRVGRAPEFVPAPALTVGLAVQPDVIRGLAKKPGFRGRGLLARFLYALPPSMLGHRDTDPPPVPEPILIEYHQKLLALMNTAFGEDDGGLPCPHPLHLDVAARESFQRFEVWVEPRLSEFGELGRITDWGGKIAGAVARIAGLLHMADHVGIDAPWDVHIPAETVERAVRVARYLIPHAVAAFAEMGADEVVERAKSISRWIAHGNLESFTKRDVHQGARSTFKRAADVDGPLAVLVERGFIRKREENASSGAGRHASPIYDVNPRWAQNDRPPVLGLHSEYCEDSETARRENRENRKESSQPIEIAGLE